MKISIWTVVMIYALCAGPVAFAHCGHCGTGDTHVSHKEEFGQTGTSMKEGIKKISPMSMEEMPEEASETADEMHKTYSGDI